MEEDPENAARHKLKMEVAARVAVTGSTSGTLWTPQERGGGRRSEGA
jgi:hypothetical protein